MAELKLKPELLPMVVQGGFYLAALVSSHFLLVKPLLGLTAERKRRTQGAVESAKGLEAKLEKIEKTYKDAQQQALTEARDLRNAQLLAGQAEAQAIVIEASETAKATLARVRNTLTEQLQSERTKIPSMVSELSETILTRLVHNSKAVVFLLGAALTSFSAHAAGGAVDPMYGIFWPYFQFIVFVSALIFLARKPISKMLDERRDNLRTRLSEAREAMVLAQRKTEEYETKLKNLQGELDALRREFAEDGVKQRDKLIADAKATAQQIVRDSERVSQQLIIEGKTNLRKEIFDQVLVVLEEKLKGETLTRVDAALRQSALSSLRSTPH
jgi:F0F1-type ATP synthase membrane subunit b/b'